MPLFSKDELVSASQLIHSRMLPTPQLVWPLLSQRAGATVWVKHENHSPIGAFKARGGISFIDWIRREKPEVGGIVTATRGNHGQAQARAATGAGVKAKILVPFGNSTEKNAAMRAFGAELIEFGQDFDEARLEAIRLSQAENLFLVPPFHKEIVRGVAIYALELFTAAPDLDTVYVPIGCGSGICGVISVRDALGLKTKVVGVVSTEAAGAKLSFEAGRIIETNSANTLADGMAVRVPVAEAFEIYSKGADRIIAVSEEEVKEAMRILYRDTHNLAEGAGAAAFAALMQEREAMAGKEVAVILSGGNVDMAVYAGILAGA
ncbi:serine/threonine dehydratase [Labrys miyagiensis]|uniref:Serine/threonine dehydratase n=1 Tax=Labrys miyagiensis TaxID=346912 RepID=A0ABQ6CH21_9HYPH|nr:threonine dehydratase [Labrys miyagiensis]GLS19516.1 serine/threonine dehydratase [Labrys miyagiensis]